MNIVYAAKIFIALSLVALVMRLVAGPGLRSVLDAKDWKTAWIGIIGTLAISCFSARIGLFFIALPIWALILSHMLGKDGTGRLPAYALLCCICPPMSFQIEHIGPLNDLIGLSPYRVLAIFLLLPEALRLSARRGVARTPAWLTLCDVLTVIYAFYWLGLHFNSLTVSTVGREALGQVLDSLLPYYVLTRACVQTDVRHRFLAFALTGVLYEAFVGIAESATRHYLYSQLQWLYGVSFSQATGLMRGSWLRAEAAFPGPLALAVLVLFGIGIWFALRKPEKNRSYQILLLALVAALLATYGRGPILAAMALFASMWMLKRMSAVRYLWVMVIAAVVLSVGWNSGIGDLVTGALSGASSDETADFNVLYRQQLLTTALALLQQSPWFGVPNYLEQMQDLRQGEGIIDLVNTYLVVALNSGVFGVLMVFTPFVVTLWRGASRMLANDYLKRETTAWIAMTAGLLLAIFTVSPISIIQPLMVWTVAIALGRLQDVGGAVPVAASPTARPESAGRFFADATR